KASWPPKALRLPYMCVSTNPMKNTPLAAISSLSAIVVRVDLPCPTRLRWTAGWAVVAGGSFVATRERYRSARHPQRRCEVSPGPSSGGQPDPHHGPAERGVDLDLAAMALHDDPPG